MIVAGPAKAGHYVRILPACGAAFLSGMRLVRPPRFIYLDTLNGSLVPPTASASSPPSTGRPYALIR